MHETVSDVTEKQRERERERESVCVCVCARASMENMYGRDYEKKEISPDTLSCCPM